MDAFPQVNRHIAPTCTFASVVILDPWSPLASLVLGVDPGPLTRRGSEGLAVAKEASAVLVPVAGPEGIQWVPEEELTEDELSTIGAHHNAISAFLSERDPKGKKLGPFEGVEVHGIPLITDRMRILDLDDDDQMTFENFYEVP